MNVIKKGSNGKTVKQLQQILNDKGYLDSVDGDFGPATHKALVKFQKDHDLLADGVAGKRTWEALEGGERASWALTEKDIEKAAVKLDVEVAAIKAVAAVESRGDGFHDDNRPKILFERHWMNRRLNSAGLKLAAQLGRDNCPDIVNTKPGGYRGGKKEHERLNKAMSLNPTDAQESASWGRFQIMGFHWEALGYESVDHFVDSNSQDEGMQLDGFVRFIKNDSNLHTALKKKDWAAFAKGYNGPSYHKNKYDEKMAEAYERYRR